MEKKKNFLVSAAYYLIITAIVYVIFKYAISTIMPFFLGFAIAACLNPFVRLLSHRFDMKRKPTAILVLLIFYATIGMLLTVLIVKLTVWLGDFSGRLPSLYRDTIEPLLAKLIDFFNRIIEKFNLKLSANLPFSIRDMLESFKSSIATGVSDISVRVLAAVSGFAAKIPRFMLELLFSVISGFFFLIDYEKIINTAKNLLPKKAVAVLTKIRDSFFLTALKYIRSYAIIMLITFSELYLGLTLIKTENAAVYALIICIVDILPILGTGAIMLPWAIIKFFTGYTGYAIGLLIIWITILIVRNIIEPKIIGKQVGLHPLVTLIAIFVGTKLFGFIGLFLLPLCLSVAASIIESTKRKNHSV